MNTPVLAQLRDLKLGGMAAALESQHEQISTYEGLSFTERLTLLVDQERLLRDQRKRDRLIRQAQLKLAASLPTSTTSTRATSTKARSPSWPSPTGWTGARTCS